MTCIVSNINTCYWNTLRHNLIWLSKASLSWLLGYSILPELIYSFPVYVPTHSLGQGQICHWHHGERALFSFKYIWTGNYCSRPATHWRTWKLTCLWCYFHFGRCLCQHMYGHKVALCPCVINAVCVWLARFNRRPKRQTAGISVNSVVSCALHTSGNASPFIRHELLWRGRHCE